MIVKSCQFEGFDVMYVLGWDCYGLFIENVIEKLYGCNLLCDEMQVKSCVFVIEQIVQQMVDFKCLGVFGDWDYFYKIMNYVNEVVELCVLKCVMECGFVYCGFKLVYWCFDCGFLLVEFEIEYVDK